MLDCRDFFYITQFQKTDSMSKTANNYTLGLALTAICSLICLALPWGTIKINNAQGLASFLNGSDFTITGTNGSITLLGISIPTWFIASLAAAGAVISILEIRSIIEIPRYAAVTPS